MKGNGMNWCRLPSTVPLPAISLPAIPLPAISLPQNSLAPLSLHRKPAHSCRSKAS